MDRAAVTLERVSKTYGRGASAVAALKEVTLEVGEGDFVSIMGPSGSGKSTLLNLIACLDAPDAGRVSVLGRDLANLSDDQRSDLRLGAIGFVFQAFNLFPSFTVGDNIAWPLEFSGVRRRDVAGRVREALAMVGLGLELCNRRPGELSGGEQQRVAIARALVIAPRLILADEPTGNLDSRTGETILTLLRALNTERGLTVVLVTHGEVAATYCDRILELRDGKVVADRPVERPAPRPDAGE